MMKQDSPDHSLGTTPRPEPPARNLTTSMTALKPKGACWYCNQPLDNVRRFCSKTCAEDYRTEEETFNGHSG